MNKIISIFFLVFITSNLFAQTDSSWTVLVVKKGESIEMKPNMIAASNSGFYLYENCVYNIELKNKRTLNGRLIKVIKDTLLLTNFINKNVAKTNKEEFDTINVNYRELSSLKVSNNFKINFDDYDFIFQKDSVSKILNSVFLQIYNDDSTKYELIPYLTDGEIIYVYEMNGLKYWFVNIPSQEKLFSKKSIHTNLPYTKRNFIWYIPNEVEQINGLAIGAWAENLKYDSYNQNDSLEVNGVNIEINPIMLFILARIPGSKIEMDSVNYKNALHNFYETKINGANLSVLGSSGRYKITGVNVGGINSTLDKMNGVSISGISSEVFFMNGIMISGFYNFSHFSKGLTIALIKNKSTFVRGVQIGLINKTTDLRGIQFGLWNKNGKRSLPFINWQFKPNASKTK